MKTKYVDYIEISARDQVKIIKNKVLLVGNINISLTHKNTAKNCSWRYYFLIKDSYRFRANET